MTTPITGWEPGAYPEPGPQGHSPGYMGPYVMPGARPEPREILDPSGWFEHTPVAAVVNVSLAVLLAAFAVRGLHIAPGWALLAGPVLGAVAMFAGIIRRVDGKAKPLAGQSIVYRGAALTTAGIWLWADTVDFSHIGLRAWVALALFATALVAGLAGLALVRQQGDTIRWVGSALFVGAALTGVAAWPVWSHSGGSRIFTAAGPLNRHVLPGWIWPTLGTLVFLAIICAILGSVCASQERDQDELDAWRAGQRPVQLHPDAQKIQALLRATTKTKELAVTAGPKTWESGGGEDYVVDGSEAGLEHDDLRPYAKSLGTRLKLPVGCGVEFVPVGDTRGVSLMQVAKVNKLASVFNYPRDYRPRTVYNRVDLGVTRDESPIGVHLRESSMGVFGEKRSGKTTCLWSTQAGLGQCTDVVLLCIDYGGGGVAGFFNEPFYRGEVDTPMIAAVAITPEEALPMVQWLEAISIDRKATSKHAKARDQVTLLPLTPERPGYFLVFDEGAEITPATANSPVASQVAAIIERLVRTAGDSGVNVIGSYLRATAEQIDPSMKMNMAARVGFRVTEPAELAYAMGGNYSLNPADTPYQGSGHILPGHGHAPRVFKNYNLLPAQQEEIGRVTAPWRPRPDDRALALPGADWFRTHWSRNSKLAADENGKIHIDLATVGYRLAGELPPGTGTTGPSTPHASTDPVPAGTDVPALPGPAPVAELDIAAAGRTLQEPDGELADAVRAASQAIAAAGGVPQLAGSPSTWTEVAGSVEVETAVNPTGPAVLEALVRHHAAAGISWTDMHRKLIEGGPWGEPVIVTPQTMGEWLKPKGAAATWLASRKDRGPYVHRDAVAID